MQPDTGSMFKGLRAENVDTFSPYLKLREVQSALVNFIGRLRREISTGARELSEYMFCSPAELTVRLLRGDGSLAF